MGFKLLLLLIVLASGNLQKIILNSANHECFLFYICSIYDRQKEEELGIMMNIINVANLVPPALAIAKY